MTREKRNAIKIVPDSDPNGDGWWIPVSDKHHMDIPVSQWDVAFGYIVPDGWHIVAVTSKYDLEEPVDE